MLKRRPSKVSPKHLDKLDKALQQQLPEISIIDLLVDATKWLPLKRFFGPLSGYQGQLSDFDKRLVISLFCYGCNLGSTQTARSIEGFSRKQIAYLNLSHTSEKDLVDATTQVINAYNQYDLPGYWGTGNTASVDGTRFDMYEQNLLSEYHIRYASYGGVGYYLVSDNYIALFSRFIPCGVREAVHLIDGLMENESDIQPTRIHGDTHAQSTVVFGISHLLGIKLMPRIRDINSLILFKPDRRQAYEHIDAILSDGINYDLIRNHYREHKIPGAKFKQITLNRLLCVASQVSLSVNAVMLSGISLEYLSTINTRTISAIKNLQLVHCSLLFFKSICAISDTLIASTPSAIGYRSSPA